MRSEASAQQNRETIMIKQLVFPRCNRGVTEAHKKRIIETSNRLRLYLEARDIPMSGRVSQKFSIICDAINEYLDRHEGKKA
jgi:hypothetical protein